MTTNSLTAPMTDMQGYTLEQARVLMSDWKQRLGRWPDAHAVKSPRVMAAFHDEFHHCWFCQTRHTEAHHFAHGARRSDERTNLIMVCSDFGGGCHRLIESGKISQADVLTMKWKLDRDQLSWLRLLWLCKRLDLSLEATP